MLHLTEKELKELRILACFNRNAEVNEFESLLFYYIREHNFNAESLVKISIPRNTLIKFAKYAEEWDADDTLGLKLIAERKARKP